jgi:uncharacterized membrane protein YcaP (DUF421 family)
VRRFTTPGRVTLVRDGVPQRRSLRREYITLEELNEKLREQGIESVEGVKAAYLEGDGQISVIRKDDSPDQRPPASVSRHAR